MGRDHGEKEWMWLGETVRERQVLCRVAGRRIEEMKEARSARS